MTKWFLPNPKRRPPKTTEWKLDIPLCEEIEDMQELMDVKGTISETIEEMFSAVTYYRWMLRKYQKRAAELCLMNLQKNEQTTTRSTAISLKVDEHDSRQRNNANFIYRWFR